MSPDVIHSLAPTPRWAPLRCGNLVLRPEERPYLMGILNITPDSFSEGGTFFDTGRAVEHGLAMAEAGADLLDVGGESSRPGAEPVSAEEELRRVLPVIEQLVRFSAVPISVDTTKAFVAEAAVAAGASLVNDISALAADEEMARVVARLGVPVVLMHLRGTPRTMQQGVIHYDDVVAEVAASLAAAVARAVRAGIAEERIVVDPGIGFGKTAQHNLALLGRMSALQRLGRPILIGPSRKSFIGSILQAEVGERLMGTAAAVAAAVLGGASILRVHDVAPMREVAMVAHAIRTERLPAARVRGDRPA